MVVGSSGADDSWTAILGRWHMVVLGFLLPPSPYVISKHIFLMLPPETIFNFLILFILAAAAEDQATLTCTTHLPLIPSISSHT